MRVPCQIPRRAASGPVWNAYRVANAADARMVIPSRIIHSLDALRALRDEFAADSPEDSREDANEADPLSQNSDVAIHFRRPQKPKNSREE
jgi:hypothetical protein